MSIRQRPAQLIDLRKACPTRRLLPAASIAYASRAILTDPFAYSDALLHGPDLGSTPLREEVAAWLSEFYSPDAGPIPPERLCITGGASQNLACILQKFTDPVYTRAVWLVAPTLRISCKIFEDNGLEGKLRVVLEDEEGLDIDSLASLLAIEEEKATSSANIKPVFKSLSNYPKIYKHIIYCMPTFKNPTSKSISLRRRRQLVDLARKYDALVIADDVFDFLRWGEDIENTRPIPRISDIDRDSAGMPDEYGNAVSNGSFSKLLAPGCRVGWLEGTEKFVIELAKAGSTQAEGAPSQLVSMFIWNLLTTGTLQSHLSDILIPVYSRRFECLKHSFDTVLSPLGVHLDNSPAIHGGWFLWLRLPDWCDAKALSEWVEKDYNLLIAYGDMYQLRDYPGSSKDPSRAIRVCLAWEEEDQLIEGVRRLAEGIKAMKEFRSPGGPMKIQNMCDA